MDKNELLAVHQLLHMIKDHVEDEWTTFPTYNALNITPHDTHRPTHEHEHAVLTLGQELATTLNTETFDVTSPGNLLDRAGDL